jgi:hypothetical protein
MNENKVQVNSFGEVFTGTSSAHTIVVKNCPDTSIDITKGSKVDDNFISQQKYIIRQSAIDALTNLTPEQKKCKKKITRTNPYAKGTPMYKQWAENSIAMGGTATQFQVTIHGTRNKQFFGAIIVDKTGGPSNANPPAPGVTIPSYPCGTCYGYNWVKTGENPPVSTNGTWTFSVSASPNSYIAITESYPSPYSSHNSTSNQPVSSVSPSSKTVTGSYQETSTNWTAPTRKCLSCEDCSLLCNSTEANGSQTRPKSCQSSLSCLEAY